MTSEAAELDGELCREANVEQANPDQEEVRCFIIVCHS